MNKRRPADTAAEQGLRAILVRRLPPSPDEREPSDEELLRLIEGNLDRAQQRRLERRLRACPYSAERIAIIRAALREAGIILSKGEG